MKVVIGIDTLIEKDHATHILELLIHMFPRAEVMTLCHKPGVFQAPIENCKITSSFLSNFVNSKYDYYHRSSLIPSACKTLKVPAETELFISLSCGFAHCFSVPANVRHVSYLFEFNKFYNFKTNLWQKIFHPYLKSFQNRKLKAVKELVFSSKALLSTLGREEEKVIPPVFNIDDFPFVKDDEHPYKFDHYVTVCNGVVESEFKTLLDVFVESGEELKIVGEDSAFESYKHHENLEFVGDHCNGPISYNTHFAKALIDLTDLEFPTHALGALCNGRPALVKRTAATTEFVPEKHGFFIDTVTKGAIQNALADIEKTHSDFDRKALRRDALRYNGRIFKTKMHKVLGTYK